MIRQIHVFGDWDWLEQVRRMGVLRGEVLQGREVLSFEYDREWLVSGPAMNLDPDLHLYEGPQYPAHKSRPGFGVFLDSSPDRWGRLLMKRREAIEARTQGRPERHLMETDFLLGVHDEQRMGGLRFRDSPDGPFLSDAGGMNVPPWARLRELENASWRIQSDESADDPKMREWLQLLMAPGSSIGGARPKAGVCDEQGNLWIAKFPGRNDEWDIGAWEMVVHQLAQKAGLTVAEARIERFGHSHHTYLSKRFDRVAEKGRRLRKHFASAMTVLGYRDGHDFSDGASYLEIASFLVRHGEDTTADLEEFWRRIVFSICIGNTDDHLRNHGFMLEQHGWRLSPAYDLNANPHGSGLSLNISENDNSLNFELALGVAGYFRLDGKRAQRILQQVVEGTRDWMSVADGLGISRSEQTSISPAFRQITRFR